MCPTPGAAAEVKFRFGEERRAIEMFKAWSKSIDKL